MILEEGRDFRVKRSFSVIFPGPKGFDGEHASQGKGECYRWFKNGKNRADKPCQN